MTAIEEILTAGSPDPLVGVVSIPANLDTRAPCLVLLNSGMMHHVGTCNLSVRIARAAAAVGISSCRFDFSGIGDSRSRTFDGTHEEREVSEVREVLETLQGRLDISRFVLCGLCSGADASLTTAEVDDRVVGIVQIDPLMFRTRSWYYNHYYQRITDPGAWRRLAGRLLGMRRSKESLAPQYLEAIDEQSRHELDRTKLTNLYRALVERDVRTLVIMTEGQDGVYNERGQFRSAFEDVEFGDLLEEQFLHAARHIITAPQDQGRVIELIKRWSLSCSE